MVRVGRRTPVSAGPVTAAPSLHDFRNLQQRMSHNMSAQAWLLLLCLSAIWGASFYFVEIGLAYLDPFQVVSLRLCSGAAARICGSCTGPEFAG